MAKWHDYRHWNKPKYGRQNRQVVPASSKSVTGYTEKGPRVDLRRKYTAPKANVFGGKKKERPSKPGSKGGARFSASTTVFGAVSLLLMIGLIATVFFAYDNSQRAEGEPFAYFSPATFLENISSEVVYVQSDTYIVGYHYKWSIIPFRSSYYGYIMVGNRRIKSENSIYKQVINDKNLVFSFIIDGVLYTTDQYDLEEPLFDGDVTVGRCIALPEIVYTWNEMPDFGELAQVWSGVGDDTSFWVALAETGTFVADFIDYQSNLLQSLLPWNSVKYSNETPNDGAVYDDSWKVWE